MVSESTWRVHGVLEFILARNYIVFLVDMNDNIKKASVFQHFRATRRINQQKYQVLQSKTEVHSPD